jgi:isopentenyl phosphate kinase
MSRVIIVKLGGSIITYKNRQDRVVLRRSVIRSLATEIAHARKNDPDLRLILIHGAGGGGHQLAHKYGLANGENRSTAKMEGVIVTRLANQRLDYELSSMLFAAKIPVVPIHTGSAFCSKGGHYSAGFLRLFDSALNDGYVPMCYGEMVADEELGMSIMSGDELAMVLAKYTGAQSIIFLSDIDGIYDRDPHLDQTARLIERTTVSELLANERVAIKKSHNIDVTGGLANKIAHLAQSSGGSDLKRVIVCNGLNVGSLRLALSGQDIGTVIEI